MRRGGRPTGSGRRRKTPTTIEREERMNRIGRVQTENVLTSSIRSRRNLADQLERSDTGLLVEAENVIITRAMRESIRRANETQEEANDRLSLDAERKRNRRSNETPEQRDRRLQYQRDYRTRIRENETPEERLHRLGLVNERRR